MLDLSTHEDGAKECRPEKHAEAFAFPYAALISVSGLPQLSVH